jgi:hypothetical protein
MFFRVSESQQKELLQLPETGMGYQVIEAIRNGYVQQKFLVLNAEILVEMDARQEEQVRRIAQDGIGKSRSVAQEIGLTGIKLITQKELQCYYSGSFVEDDNGPAQESYSSKEELFIRFSAFEKDRRFDESRTCLRPGSFAISLEDFMHMQTMKLNLVEHLNLPAGYKIKWVYYFRPGVNDRLQHGEPAYFEHGTAIGTHHKRIPY